MRHGVLAGEAALPDGRIGQRHDAKFPQASNRPTFSGMVRRSENSIWLVASCRPRLRKAVAIDRVSFAE